MNQRIEEAGKWAARDLKVAFDLGAVRQDEIYAVNQRLVRLFTDVDLGVISPDAAEALLRQLSLEIQFRVELFLYAKLSAWPQPRREEYLN